MNYIEYIGIVLFTLFRKIFGLVWIYFAVPFRAYSNNTMFNYVLENKIYLKRLLERPISPLGFYFYEGKEFYGYLISPYHNTQGGYIKYRKISWLEYTLNKWLIWFWLDADSNEDTYSWGQVEDLRKEWNWYSKVTKNLEKPYYGNSFDLGDARADHPAFNFWTCTSWTWRNTAYNAKYFQYEISKEEWKTGKYFYIKLSNGWEFGWVPFGADEDKQGRLCFIER